MKKELVIVIDFGGQYNQLVARRVRECNVYCEIYSYKTDLEKIKAMNPKGIILTGGPNSCYEADSPTCNKELFELGIPVLGLCYGAQLMMHVLGGKVEKADVSEYGKTEVLVDKTDSKIFEDVSDKTICWMSHTDYISQVAPGFEIAAHTADCPVATAQNEEKKLYAIQFHPEVLHTVEGKKMLSNFVLGVCGCAGDWKMDAFVEHTIKEIREKIIYHTAFIETALDDPEHISVDGYGEVLKEAAEEVIDQLKELIDSSDDGRIMKEGIQTVILGKPNAGKSSLLNILAGHDRAIVTDIEGTTRDVLEEQIRLQGLTLNIIDTAGIRQTDDIVEKMGVDKAKEYAKEADLIIYVVDASRNLDENDEKIFDLIYDKRTVILLNKSDLDTVVTEEMIRERISQKGVQKQIPVIAISAKEEQGIKELENTVKAMFLKGDLSFNEEVYITNARQKNALVNARESMKKVIFSIDAGMPEDFYSIDLMDAYESLGNITGESIGEDLVNEIFSKFCMGK